MEASARTAREGPRDPAGHHRARCTAHCAARAVRASWWCALHGLALLLVVAAAQQWPRSIGFPSASAPVAERGRRRVFICESSDENCALHVTLARLRREWLHRPNWSRDVWFWRHVFEPEAVVLPFSGAASFLPTDVLVTRWPFVTCNLRGADLASFPGTIVYLHGERCDATTFFARNRFDGARRLVYAGGAERECIAHMAALRGIRLVAHVVWPHALQVAPCYAEGASKRGTRALLDRMHASRARAALDALGPRPARAGSVAYLQSNCVPARESAFDTFAAVFAERGARPAPVSLGKCSASHPELHAPEGAGRSNHFEESVAAFSRFRFALVMESSIRPFYATERIINAFLAGVVPVYAGHRDTAVRWLNPDAVVWLDLEDARSAAERVVRMLANRTDYVAALRAPVASPDQIDEWFAVDVAGARARSRFVEAVLGSP